MLHRSRSNWFWSPFLQRGECLERREGERGEIKKGVSERMGRGEWKVGREKRGVESGEGKVGSRKWGGGEGEVGRGKKEGWGGRGEGMTWIGSRWKEPKPWDSSLTHANKRTHSLHMSKHGVNMYIRVEQNVSNLTQHKGVYNHTQTHTVWPLPTQIHTVWSLPTPKEWISFYSNSKSTF